MDKFIEEEITRFKPVAVQLSFEGVSIDKILNTLINYLIMRLNKNGQTKQTTKTVTRGN